jgi:hypothetical protein
MHPDLDGRPQHEVRPLLFPNRDAFWLDDMRRMTSQEAEYGRFWRAGEGTLLHLVNYIQDTGEIYAQALSGAESVRVLGVVPADQVTSPADRFGHLYYRTLDTILCDYADSHVTGDRIEWITGRLRAAGQVVGCTGCPFEYLPAQSPCRRLWTCARPDRTWLAKRES